MIEIPESKTISLQAGRTLINRRITEVINATSPHKFAFYNDDPAGYSKLLTGKHIKTTKGHGMFVDIYCDDNIVKNYRNNVFLFITCKFHLSLVSSNPCVFLRASVF